LPVKDEFLIHIDEDGRPALKWMEMSGYKLHKLIDLLIVNIQGTSVQTFFYPLKEATGYGLDFMAKFKDTSLCDHTINPMRTTQVIAEAKNAFSENNMRMHKWIKVKENSMAVVFNIFTDLRDSTKPSSERERNELIMRLFVMNGMVSNQFPTVPSTLEYFTLVNMCEDILTQLAEAYRAVCLWAHPALNSAMNMSEHGLQKKLSHQCQEPFTPKPQGGGVPPGGGKGSGNPKGNPNPSGIPQGNPVK
jgi:hypothetical protein